MRVDMDNASVWHTQGAGECASRLGTDAKSGLTHREADIRLESCGPNMLARSEQRTLAGMFLAQFKDFMILVLVAAAVVSGVVGELADTIAIVVIVALNAVIGAAQEYKAEKAMEALRDMAAPDAVVVREGARMTIPASELVPGDLVVLEAGMVVAADLRITDAAALRLDESALTGESVPVDKAAGPVAEKDAPLGDRACMAFRGAKVINGRGAGLAVATGMDTELGRIAGLIQKEGDTRTPLQKRLASFGRKLSLAIIGICAVIFGAGLLRGEPAVLMFLTAVSLAVAAIPEALPAVVTVSLAIGARRMVRQDALIRNLPAVETLGSVTYICTDKTGTLTVNRMKVKWYYADGCAVKGQPSNPVGALGLMMTAMALNNDAAPEAAGNVAGDPTEVALYEAARDAGFDRRLLQDRYPRMAELPFDSVRKLMTTVHEGPDGGYLVFTKGAAEQVIQASVDMLAGGGSVQLDRDAATLAAEAAAADGLRVLAFGYKRLETMPAQGPELESGLTLLGFAGLMDPPREESAGAVRECMAAGIKTVMITGDHPVTARRVAADLGIPGGEVTTGAELAGMSPEELKSRVEGISVYARVAPEQKLDIVRALQDRGQFVAMTGDGVNDAPALKKADIGVSMGKSGTEVAREASDIVLLDDNFATIVKAVREGRRIYDNIRKFIKYAMTGNTGEIITLFLAPFLGLPMPLLPIHILWINLVTDGLPGLALAFEPAEKDTMARPPRKPTEEVFARGLAGHIVWVGLLMGSVSILSQAWAISGGGHWRSMVFTVLCLSQMGHVLAIRSDTESFFSQGFSSNLPLTLAVALTFALQMAVVYVPFLNPIFKTAPLSVGELGVSLLLSSVVFLAVESSKMLKRRRLRVVSGPAANA